MQFSANIGDNGQHTLEYDSHDGFVILKMNGREVKRTKRRSLLTPISEVHILGVGDEERVEVRIEVEKGILSRGKTRVFDNGRLVKIAEGI